MLETVVGSGHYMTTDKIEFFGNFFFNTFEVIME